MSNKATRLITLIMLLQRKPNQKAAELAEELGISIRSLHRYFNMLEEIGIPVTTERGPYGGFSLVRGYRMPPLVFTPEEATAVYLGTGLVEAIWGDLYSDSALGALAKLDNVLPEEQLQEIRWAQRSLVTADINKGTRDSISDNLKKIRRAIREHRQIITTYRTGGRSSEEERLIHPYALVYRWGWWYVIAFCTLREANRAFRLDRMDQVSLSEHMFNLPPDFDIHQYLDSEFENQPLFTIRLSISAELSGIVKDYQNWWQSMEPQKDGSTIVTYQMTDLLYPAKTILAYGPGVTVLDPPELRQLVAHWAKRIFELNQ